MEGQSEKERSEEREIEVRMRMKRKCGIRRAFTAVSAGEGFENNRYSNK